MHSTWIYTSFLVTSILVTLVTSATPKPTDIDIEIRLVNGRDGSEGRVEIRQKSPPNSTVPGPWGTICNDQYEQTNKAASVICRQLGYVWGEGTMKFGSGSKTMPIHLDDLACMNGTETSITKCRSNAWDVHNCFHHEDVGAICYNQTVRLSTPAHVDNAGVVQLMYNYKWGDACDTGWNDSAATVVCKQLGFQVGVAECCSALGPSDFSNVDKSFQFNCNGSEATLQDCNNTSILGMCDYSHRASVVCHNTSIGNVNTTFDIRLADGDDNWGRVEVRHAGIWGQICNDQWTDVAANITCRQLGHGFVGGVAFGGVAYGPVSVVHDPFWLVDLKCNGQESSIENCSYTQWGEPLVFSCKAAYVLCYKTTGLQLDIVGGELPSVGSVQLTYDGVPGYICTDEWTDNDAYLVCQMKGYADGKVSTAKPSTGPFYLRNTICANPPNLYMCLTMGWKVNTESCTASASVRCFKQVRLSGGDERDGILEVHENNAWYGICPLGFKPEYADLACKELGLGFGTILPRGAYGKYYKHRIRPYLNCTGNTSSIADCGYSSQVQCAASNYQYVAIGCHKEKHNYTAVEYSLSGPTPDASYGGVMIRTNLTWGEICSTGWSDREAGVFCKTLGRDFIGGMAFNYGRRIRVPTLAFGVRCRGNETSFLDCKIAAYTECTDLLRAGVLCYKESAPSVSLVDGGNNFGRVRVSSDDVSGSVCDSKLTITEASVICKEINSNFTQGEPYTNFPATTDDVILHNIDCSGLEKSLFQCANTGWRSVKMLKCLDHSYDVGVYCYGKVKLMDGVKTAKYITGRVVVQPVSGSTSVSDWTTICGDGFDQVDADVVCKEMGFDAAKLLAPGSFGVKPLWKFYTNMTCKADGSDVHKDCTYETGQCRMPSTHNYASVMCLRQELAANPNLSVTIENGYHGRVMVHQHGINGSICVDGWDETDANVLCKGKGFAGGVVLGVPEIYSRKEVIWFTNVSCTGNEKGLLNCARSENVSMHCATSVKSAGVLCYKSSAVSIKLVNDDYVNYYGRVEVVHDGVSGTICDSDWSTYDARVTCRQLGFPDGVPKTKSYYGGGNGSVVLLGFTCDSTEDTLLSCPNLGWKSTYLQSACHDHKRDAGVICKRNVLTSTADSYGPVQVWKNGVYYLVCSDDFDDNDANVICRTMGYSYGKSLCCSAFGEISLLAIGFAKSECTGREMNYNTCDKIAGESSCESKQYASVVCSREQPLDGFDVSIAASGSGPIKIHYMNHDGFMCTEGFTDLDAMVTCKQLGYTGGYAYKYHNQDVDVLKATTSIHWFKRPDCTGTEHRLEECPGVKMGNSDCSIVGHAAAFCYKTSDQSKFAVRIKNSPHPGEGYVQVNVNGTWGSICTLHTRISNFEATVVCRQYGFKYGVVVPSPEYPPLEDGTVWINKMTCNGNETSILDCTLSGMGDIILEPDCHLHRYDMAVKCYTDVRLSGSVTPSYGMVQVLNETVNQWYSVCDTDFDDVDARVACRAIGYKDGKAQCCSSMGPKMLRYNSIFYSNVSCTGKEPEFSACPRTTGNDTCLSGNYASVICTDKDPAVEGLVMSIANDLHYGNVLATRYGVKGSVCDVGWDHTDAKVLCHSLGYLTGWATNGTNTAEVPMVMTSINCSGTEKNISQCRYPPLISGHECNNRRTRAAVMCSMEKEPIRYRLGSVRDDLGRAEIYLNGRWGTICDLYWEDKDADVFCRQAGYLYGESTVLASRGDIDQPIFMSHVECNGNETDFLQCRATWKSSTISRCSHYDDAGVKCYRSARLNRGDYRTKRTNGIVEVYMYEEQSLATWYTICGDTFTDKEAAVVCQVLGHDHGLAVCCSPYGYNTSPMSRYQLKCNGTEKQTTQCEKIPSDKPCPRQNYASVTCYNDTSSAYSVSLKGSLKYTGQVVLSYLGVPGRICWSGWNDPDARVVCRELGFKNGSAYYHYKSSFIYLDYNGPYWTSEVKCTGDERQLSQCPHAGFGNVTKCDDRGHYAGVICYDNYDIAYRISGGDARYGRVEVSYNNEWYSICSTSWGYQEANVTCRQLGYVTGDTYSGEYITKPGGTDKRFAIDFRCNGEESSLNECTHEGIQEANYCESQKDDRGVFCYTSVKLSGEQGTNSGNGTVLLYQDRKWSLVCDEEFDDVTARQVCRELGFYDGKAICCSAFGKVYENMLTNQTLHCNGSEESIEECVQQRPCNSSSYASVVCFKQTDIIDEDAYTFNLTEKDQGQVLVDHLGVTGRICSRDWDDYDATVLCRSRGFNNGLAYQHSENNVLQSKRGPYWISGFNCTGSEKQLIDCPFSSRLSLGNCSGYDIASVMCYNESGIEYRMKGGDNFGRVEMSVGGKWGTVCDQFWDRREASVFCRQLNFTDGEAIGSAHFGAGSGPIWLSHLECMGTEHKLHQCPHRGFANEFSYDWWFPLPCETHNDDAGVFCYKSVRFNNGHDTSVGGLEIYREGAWHGVCDANFDQKAALVACRSIKKGFVDARPIPGSGYGKLNGNISISGVRCNGTENDLMECDMDYGQVCPSGHYVSVYCSNTTINDTGFQLRLAPDSLSSNVHGILEVRVKGIWGRVCLHDFNDVAASVACRHLGYDGGVAYLHIMKNDKPVLMRDVQCEGHEPNLDQCKNKQLSPDLENCHYGSNDAGVICYNRTNDIGFDYQLVGGNSSSIGRVEIGYAGRWGLVCAWSWQTADAKVLCRGLGYKDGIVSYLKNTSLTYSTPWVTGFFCQGHEPTPMTCLNTGFNSTFLTDLCQTGRDPGAYTQCFNETIEPLHLRLVNGPTKYSGRVEVYVSGAEQWGTICDDYWDDDDATVVCRDLGFYGGKAQRKAPYGPGSGPIWFDNVKCLGDEASLFNCTHRGIGTHNCNHTEDVGVTCLANPPTTLTPLITTTKKPATTLAPTTAAITTQKTTTPPTTKAPTTKQTTHIDHTTKKPTSPIPTTQTPNPTTPKPTTQKPTTPKPTTPKPTTQKPTTQKPTTQKPTTPKVTTKLPTITTAADTQKPQSTAKSKTTTTENINITVKAQQTSPAKANIGMAVGIPVALVIIIAVIVVILLFIRMRRGKKPGYSREQFDDSIINRSADGTISASNQLYDLDMQPSSPNGLSDVSATSDDKMTLNRNGQAHYKRGLNNGDYTDPNGSAFSNPLYEARREFEEPDVVSGVNGALPTVSEIDLPDNTHTNA